MKSRSKDGTAQKGRNGLTAYGGYAIRDMCRPFRPVPLAHYECPGHRCYQAYPLPPYHQVYGNRTVQDGTPVQAAVAIGLRVPSLGDVRRYRDGTVMAGMLSPWALESARSSPLCAPKKEHLRRRPLDQRRPQCRFALPAINTPVC